MAIKQIFKTRMPNINCVLKNGKQCTFGHDCKYLTEIPYEINELENEVTHGHPQIYRDAEEKEIDTSLQDAIKAAQQRAALEVLEAHNNKKEAEKQASQKVSIQGQGGDGANSAGTKMGMTAAQLLNVSNTAQLGGLAAGSSSGGVNLGIGTGSK